MIDFKQSDAQHKQSLQSPLAKQPVDTIHPAIRLDEFTWMKQTHQQQSFITSK
jgi:hypothetical protein